MRVLLVMAAISATGAIAAPATNEGGAIASAVDAAGVAGFTGEVLVGHGDKPVFDRTIGMVRPARWVWGSVSKQVTAALVMAEVDRGTLTLDDTIAKWLPGFVNAETGRVTVHQLLQHISGLPNPDESPEQAGAPGFYMRSDAAAGGSADAIGYCAGPAKQPPGRFSYNNCDTIVVAAILEKATGKRFADLLAARIARPIGLKSLRLARAGEHPIAAHSKDGPLPRINIASFGASGAMLGTAADLLRFDAALVAHRIVTPGSTAIMWSGDPKLGYLALGAWSFPAALKGCAAPVALIERRGAVDGVQARNIIAPALDRSLIVFTDDADREFGEIWQGKGLSYELTSAAFCG